MTNALAEDPEVFAREGRVHTGNGAADPSERRQLNLARLARYDGYPIPAREWSVLDRFPLRNVSLLSGEGSIGKTQILTQLAAAQTFGRDWLRSVPEQGPVLMVSCEEDEDEIARRLKPSLELYEVTFGEALKAGLNVCSLAGKDAVLAQADGNEKITTTPLFDELKQMAGDIKPRSLILDNAADIFGGNENSRVQVRQFFMLLRQLAIIGNSAVIVSSHPSLTGLTSRTGLSGSTAWHNSARARSWLRTAATAEGDKPDSELRELVFLKSNYGPLGEPVLLRWRDGLFVPDNQPGALDKIAAKKRADDTFLALLKLFNEQGQNASSNRAPTFAPADFAKHPDNNGINKDAFEAAMQRLLISNTIRIEQFGPPSHLRTRLVVA